MVQAHLGHNCRLADNIYIANGALLAGHVRVDEGAFISGNVVFHQFCRVGSYAMVGGFTGVNKDVPPYMIVRGPSIVRGINVIGLRRAGFKASDLRQIKKAYRLIYLSGEPLEKALEKLEGTDAGPHVKVLVDFIISSKRGICKAKEKNGDFFD
jgi:UDP-N-acetylglucosamine acyltransferase